MLCPATIIRKGQQRMAVEMKIDGNLVKHLREERAWSQEHLASVAGLSTRTVQRLEADGNASIESRMAIAAVFGVEPAKLMQGQGPAGVDTLQGSTPKSTLRMDPYRWVLLIMVWIMFLLIGGYMIGKDLALSDSRASEQCTQGAEDCKPVQK